MMHVLLRTGECNKTLKNNMYALCTRDYCPASGDSILRYRADIHASTRPSYTFITTRTNNHLLVIG